MHNSLYDVLEKPPVSFSGHRFIKNIFHEALQRAAQSLEQLVGRKMGVDQYALQIIRGENFFDCFENQLEQTYFASILKIDEMFGSNVVLLVSDKDGAMLYQLLTGENVDSGNKISDETINGIGELNNILGSTFINSLANFLKITIHSTIPLNTYDMLGAILQGIVLQDEYLNKQILYANAAIRDTGTKGFTVKLIILSDWQRFGRILDRV